MIRYRLRVRYPECDMQQIVFNARYGEWADLATTEFLRTRLSPSGGVPIDYRLVRQETQWKSPARYDDVVECHIRAIHLGNSSFVIQTEMFHHPSQRALASVTTTYVQVDPLQGTKKELSPDIRAMLLSESSACIDHSGLGDGRILRRFPRSSARSMPWKNGGGVTYEYYREGNGPEGWTTRLSLAHVNASGPFSHFPGVDRVICCVEGNGFRLDRPDGLSHSVFGDPFSFHGEDAWDCHLLDGPVMDFNLMRRRSEGPGGMRKRGAGWISGRFFLCLESGEVGGERVETLELLELEGMLRGGVVGLEIHFSER